MDRARRAPRAVRDGGPGPRARLILRLVAALAVLAALAPGAGAQGTDPVRVALERGDVFAGSGQLGARAAAARHDLAAVAAELRADDRPVKLAVVPGRGETRALLVYARRLRRDLDFDGTVVLTTPGGATAAAGPRESAEVTLAMRRVRIGRIPDPVQRLISAAEVTAAPRRSDGGTTTALTL
ncbi:MAG TPA: hypothetical protein VL422_07525, partial [Miltoncostaea sp.]|nr:hypothetical protein [Miltoncostaea sp.]